MKGSPFPEISIRELADQIQSKSKCEDKLPAWFKTQGIYFPKPINIEQTSSERTAAYKAKLVSGRSLIDLTGGLGVDSYFFSKRIKRVIHCETDGELSAIAAHNFKVLKADNISCLNSDGISYLQNNPDVFDWIYVDPSRRNKQKAKVFKLGDCLPDIGLHLDILLERSTNIMVKLSPLLDISATINTLKFVKEIHVVAVKNEVKELIFLIQKDFKGNCLIKAVNIHNDHLDNFESRFPSTALASYSQPEKYLYEPNAALLKSGLFNEVSSQLNINKLHKNSHLYTSEKLIKFPGRRFQIKSVIKYSKKQIKKNLGFKKSNITTRNFYDSVAKIRKITGIKEGGDDYLFFTTDEDNKAIVIHCLKV